MFKQQKIHELDDFFLNLGLRPGKGVFFYRINAYTDEIGSFIRKYYEAARQSGVIIEGKIPNPDEKNLAYYNEIMGGDFKLSVGFISDSFKKWLPRMNNYQRDNVAASIYDSLDSLRKAGKNENMLKNAYIKFMCWLYYKFERIVNLLGENRVPKILYEGEPGNYELMIMSVLSNAGCDIVLLQYNSNKKCQEAGTVCPDELVLPGMVPFPEGFSLKVIREEIQNLASNERLYGRMPEITNCTNAWTEGKGLADICKNTGERGTDSRFFYNCFIQINGVEDKLLYVNELYKFGQELNSKKRKTVIINGMVSKPLMEEISAVNRKNYQGQDQMLSGLAGNLVYPSNITLQQLMVKAFLDIMIEESKKTGMNINKLTNKGVYLVCWMKRYRQELFAGWKEAVNSCFIHMGGCKDSNEALFLKMLARLPVDVLVLNPGLDKGCCLTDSILYEINYTDTMDIAQFPQENSAVKIGTVAYHAERELDTIMYQDSGMYRNQQYQKADVVTLQTMYEEIKILWNQELKYRPNFAVTGDKVNIPVIFAKVSGVKDGQANKYWMLIKELIDEDTFLVKDVPLIKPESPNPMKAYSAGFYKNGRLQRTKIKEHKEYQYGVLRDEVQEHILDKLQILIDQKIIKGTFENGTEYTIIATILNLPKEITRLIQKFDFTKKNPKFIYINTGEKTISLEDSILAAFLNLAGFDVIFFVPTGYQTVEKYYNKQLIEEHQAGSYMYELSVPDIAAFSPDTRPKSWRDRIFKRGR